MVPVRISSIHELKTLIRSFHPVVAIESVEEERVDQLILAASEELNMPVFEWTVVDGVRRYGEPHATMGQTTFAGNALRHIESLKVDGVYIFRGLDEQLGDAVVQRMLKEVAVHFRGRGSVLILTGGSIEIPEELKQDVVFFPMELPNADELSAVVNATVQSLRFGDVGTVTLDGRGREELLHALSGMTVNQARQAVARAVLEDGRLDAADTSNINREKGEAIRDGGLLEYYPAQENHFELGGFAGLKGWLDRAAMGFSQAAADMNLSPPRGILLVGVQGCGKSLAAKVVARQWGVPLLKLDAARLYDKYVGETEKNFVKATKMAAAMAPAVLWIDEIEKALATGGEVEADGGVSQRLLGSFLSWLQEKDERVFVVGTVNRIDVLPPELLRKGRFDEIFFVDLPTEEERERIFEIHLRMRRQAVEGYDLGVLVRASEGFSGAEIEQAVIGALYRALHEGLAPSTELIVGELEGTVPLSRSRWEDVAALRDYAKGRFVEAAG
ncbi:MAG: AAA family ATPase [Verrucomicrobiota bacterium]